MKWLILNQKLLTPASPVRGERTNDTSTIQPTELRSVLSQDLRLYCNCTSWLGYTIGILCDVTLLRLHPSKEVEEVFIQLVVYARLTLRDAWAKREEVEKF